MPSINVSEQDFETVAGAALDAWDRGYSDEAKRLDKLARKINAALSEANLTAHVRSAGMTRMTSGRSWRDVPSVLTGKVG